MAASDHTPDPFTAVQDASRAGSATARTRRSRHRLILLALAVQALVLCSGWMAVYRYSRDQTAGAVERIVLDQNVSTAEAVANTIREMGPQSIEFDTPEWERLQSMVENIRLSSDGFVCVLDPETRVLCHPLLRQNPGMRGMPMAGAELVDPDGEIVVLGSADRNRTLSGHMVVTNGDTHFVATTALPSIGGRLTVHQPEDGLDLAGSLATRSFVISGAVVGTAVLVVTTLIGFYFMRRHDRALEAINEGLESEVERRVDKGLATRHALITGLAKLADYRDTDTGVHLDRIASYARLIAEAMQRDHPETIDGAWIERLCVASTMHDIGKVGIPDSILLKPGKLTEEERAIMERHPSIGADTLLSVREAMGEDELVEMSLRIALYHHEKWDGSGYPTRLAGEDIPLEARIVALADVYDALTSARVYKAAMPHQKAVAIIRDGAGTHFDPEVVERFLHAHEAFDRVRADLQPERAAAAA